MYCFFFALSQVKLDSLSSYNNQCFGGGDVIDLEIKEIKGFGVLKVTTDAKIIRGSYFLLWVYFLLLCKGC